MSEGTEEKVVEEKRVGGGGDEVKGMNGERTSPLKEEPKKDELIEVEETKSEDKLEIEGEEREKMVVRGVEVEKRKRALEEAALQASRKRAPTGGIKIPGFLRSTRSKEKKDGEMDVEEGADLLEQSTTEAKSEEEQETKQPSSSRFPNFSRLKKLQIPFIKIKKDSDKEGKDKEGAEDKEDSAPSRPKLLNAIKLPALSSVIQKKPKLEKQEQTETMGVGQAGLASMETLDDSNHGDTKDADNMENVKLDAVEVDPEKAALEVEEEQAWNYRDWDNNVRLVKQHKFIAGGIVMFLFLVIVVIIIAICGPRVHIQSPIINGKYITAVTSCGPVEGVMEDGAFIFRGIPYARPPVDDLRWRPPQMMTLHDCWNNTFKAHNATPSCWQIYPDGSMDGVENCLTIDIYTPNIKYDSPLPVVVVIGAETLMGGSPSKLVPSGAVTYLKDIVMVRPNFRMSVLGFLAASPLTHSSYPLTSGNYGLMDIVAALNWVQLNIQHFGGDSKSVTVLAYRAGATLVSSLLSTHKIDRLFTRAWLSTPSSVFPNETLYESEMKSEPFLKSLSCGDNITAECLRKLDVEELLDVIPDSWKADQRNLPNKTEPEYHQSLVIDGILIRENPVDVWRRGNVTVHVVMGATAQCETNDLTKLKRQSWEKFQALEYFKRSQVGAKGLLTELQNLYNTSFAGVETAIADIRTICPLLGLHKVIKNSHLYIAKMPKDDGVTGGGSDVDAILGRIKPDSSEQRRFVSSMQKMFYHYVAHGTLPRYRMATIEQDPQPIKDLPNCYFWDSNGFDKFARVD